MYNNPEFWILVSFVIALVILFRLGAKSVVTTLDSYGERIATQLDDARKLREEAEALLAEQQRRQRDAINDAKAIITQAQAEAERITGEAVAELERAIYLRELHARERIAISESRAVIEVRDTVVDIAIEATRRALAASLNPGRQSALIDQSIQDVARYLA